MRLSSMLHNNVYYERYCKSSLKKQGLNGILSPILREDNVQTTRRHLRFVYPGNEYSLFDFCLGRAVQCLQFHSGGIECGLFITKIVNFVRGEIFCII